MTATNTIAKRAFAVWWNDLERWIIPPSVILRHSLPKGWECIRIGNLVQQVAERIKTEPKIEYKMAGVRWYGEGVFHRETVRGDAMSSRQVAPLISGALIYNRLFAWKASFAVVPPELADCHVSSEFPQFIPDKTRLLPEYLYLFCTCEATIRAVNAVSTGSAAVSRNRFKEVEFLNFEIPLPPINEQKAIVNLRFDAKRKISNAEKRIIDMEMRIKNIISSTLGLKHAQKQHEIPKAFALWWRNVSVWGAGFNRNPSTNADIMKSDRYQTMRLGDVAFINPSTEIKIVADDTVTFVPMEAVSDVEGKIVSSRLVAFKEVSNGYTKFQEKDILWAKITPCMQNGKSAIALNLESGIGFGSTEFHIIRTRDDNIILPEYIWIILRMKSIRELAQKYFVGSAGQQRVPAVFLEDLVIPLPPLSIQKQLVKDVEADREEIVRERESIDRLSREIKAEIEALILGIKKL